MNLPIISWKYLIAKPLNTVLNVLILSLGVAMIIVLLLVSNQLEENFTKNAKGIDLVVGAKGSPLQLILCSIFHIDFPTGNINLQEARQLAANPMVKKAIPLALGDSYQGYRIVGTNHTYPDHYSCDVAEGKLWEEDMEATVGSEVARKLGLKIGDTFYGAHGLDQATSHVHEDHAYVVTGILAPSQSVIDNLILTNVASVWKVHEQEGITSETSEETPTEEPAKLANTRPMMRMMAPTANPGEPAEDPLSNFPKGSATQEITSMLLKFKSPMGAITMPRFINKETGMQAASPPFEMSRLISLLGVGIDTVRGFAYLMVFIAVLSIFIALYNALKERRYDLAVMRSLGSSKASLFKMVILEGIFITLISSLIGLALGHGVLHLMAVVFEKSDHIGLQAGIFLLDELWIIGGALFIGFLTALIPAMQAYRTDISTVLAQG